MLHSTIRPHTHVLSIFLETRCARPARTLSVAMLSDRHHSKPSRKNQVFSSQADTYAGGGGGDGVVEQ